MIGLFVRPILAATLGHAALSSNGSKTRYICILGPVPPSISGYWRYWQEMDETISTAALMAGLSFAWLHLKFPPFPASILQSKAVLPELCMDCRTITLNFLIDGFRIIEAIAV